jgi:hypothetical protein
MRKSKKVASTWGFDAVVAGAPVDPFDSPFSAEWRVPSPMLPARRPFLDKSLDAIRLFNDDLLYAAKALDGFLNGESLCSCSRLAARGCSCRATQKSAPG